MNNIPKIKHQSKTDQVINKITDLILSGRLEKNKLIPPENILCERLGVSRSILRESMKMLAAKGMVEIKQGYGTFVRVPKENVAEEALSIYMQTNKVTLIQLMEVRIPLEKEIARLAALRRKEEHLEAMEETFKVMERYGKDLKKCVKADTDFHQILVASTENPVFGIISRSIIQLLKHSRQVTISYYGVEKVIREHKAIKEAIRKRDAKSALLSMETHMKSALNDLKRFSPRGEKEEM